LKRKVTGAGKNIRREFSSKFEIRVVFQKTNDKSMIS